MSDLLINLVLNFIDHIGLPMSLLLQLSATDVSARTTMKGAAKCDKHCELQNSVNQQVLERILRFRDIPESMPASVSILIIPASDLFGMLVCVCVPGRLYGLWRIQCTGSSRANN